MDDARLNLLNEASARVSGWSAILDQIQRMTSLSFDHSYYGVTEEMRPPESIWLSYQDKLAAWAQEGLAKAKEDFARL